MAFSITTLDISTRSIESLFTQLGIHHSRQQWHLSKQLLLCSPNNLSVETLCLSKYQSWHSISQGILKGEVSLYHWPPLWLVWNQLYDNWQFLFLFAKQTNPNQSNRRSMVQWYFPPLVFPVSATVSVETLCRPNIVSAKQFVGQTICWPNNLLAKVKSIGHSVGQTMGRPKHFCRSKDFCWPKDFVGQTISYCVGQTFCSA